MHSGKKNLSSSWFSKSSTKNSRSGRARLGFESLERREMMSVVPGSTVYSPDHREVAWLDQQTISGQTYRRVCEGNVTGTTVAGRQVGTFHSGIDLPTFSPNSAHLCYRAVDPQGCSVWEDGTMLGSYHNNMADPFFSANSAHVACVTWGDKAGYSGVLEDGTMVGGQYYYGSIEAPQFSPDCNRMSWVQQSYRASDLRETDTVWTGSTSQAARTEGTTHHIVGKPVFSPNSAHLAYIYFDAFTDGKNHAGVCEDGRMTGYHDNVYGLQYTSDSACFTFNALDNGRWTTYTGRA